MPRSPKRIRDDLMAAVATLVEDEQNTLDIIERFERADRRRTPARQSGADILRRVRGSA